MKFGLDVGVYGHLARPKFIGELAALAESAGFYSVWLADHVVFPSTVDSRYPYNPSGRFPVPGSEPLMEPLATMGVLVGATRRVRIGTAVLVMPYRNPVLLAKMLITLDAFSGGRIVLGAGVGWLREEFEALGAPPFGDRGAVTDEYIDIVKALCAGGEVAYRGRHYDFDTVLSYPPSAQRPAIPILVGGTSNAALRRTARRGDGWLSVALTMDRLPERVDTLRQLWNECDRTPGELRLVHKLFIDIGNERASVYGGREPGTGTVAQILSDLGALIDLGYGEVIVRYLGDDPEAQRVQIARFADEVASRFV